MHKPVLCSKLHRPAVVLATKFGSGGRAVILLFAFACAGFVHFYACMNAQTDSLMQTHEPMHADLSLH